MPTTRRQSGTKSPRKLSKKANTAKKCKKVEEKSKSKNEKMTEFEQIYNIVQENQAKRKLNSTKKVAKKKKIEENTRMVNPDGNCTAAHGN